MRLERYINEWRVEQQYAGRGLLKSTKSDNVIVWYYMIFPTFKGLIWTTSDGTTYINDKKIKKINYPINKMTHKKQLAELYNELKIGDNMDGDLRSNVERLNEANPRGRIVDNVIYVYEFEKKRLNDKAINAIYRHIDEPVNEAKVKTSDADVFLNKHAPVFMWSPKEGFLWSVFNKETEEWEVYKGNKKIISYRSGWTYITHSDIFEITKSKSINDFIYGRINPNGREIYIHDMKNRAYSGMIEKRFDYYVNKAIDAVYKYMGDYIK